MKRIYSFCLILSFGMFVPIATAESEIPDDVGKFADERMEKYVTKQGRRIGKADRAALRTNSTTVFLMAPSAARSPFIRTRENSQ